ncbi:MAG: hypothetical protein A2V66_03400 [Ignavibacteria bacterium RBG_13_36_8]|nr:MAG: hypothetical protein A2V66_03400 [Ignavibacteria bacterium RBG_13_36_8]
MKKLLKKSILILSITVLLLLVFVLIFDKILMPWYVSESEEPVPNVIGLNKDEAIRILKESNLSPILGEPRYDMHIPKDYVIFQKPNPGIIVKENRRVYLFISGGEPLIKIPSLVGKTFRDAKVTIERLGLTLGDVQEIRSEFQANTVVEQEPAESESRAKGTTINLKISVGPRIGMIRVPNILAKSLRDAESILRRNSLRLGKINYLESPTLLPNTIIDQYPSEDKLVSVGDSVDVVVTK